MLIEMSTSTNHKNPHLVDVPKTWFWQLGKHKETSCVLDPVGNKTYVQQKEEFAVGWKTTSKNQKSKWGYKQQYAAANP